MPLAQPQQPRQAAGHGAERDLRACDGETPGALPGLDVAQSAWRQPAGRVQGLQADAGQQPGGIGVCPAQPPGDPQRDGEHLRGVADVRAGPVHRLPPLFQQFQQHDPRRRGVDLAEVGCRERRDSSAIRPAISTPVGPVPTTTKVSQRHRTSGSGSRLAISNAPKIRPRTSSASSRDFMPGASWVNRSPGGLTAGCPGVSAAGHSQRSHPGGVGGAVRTGLSPGGGGPPSCSCRTTPARLTARWPAAPGRRWMAASSGSSSSTPQATARAFRAGRGPRRGWRQLPQHRSTPGSTARQPAWNRRRGSPAARRRCGSGSPRATRAPRPQRVSTSRATHPSDGAPSPE